LVVSVAAAALGVVLNTTQDVKADQIVQPPVNKVSTKQTLNKIVPVANTNNNDITDNSLEQADNSDNEDKTVQSSASEMPSVPPKKEIKTVANDITKPWQDSGINLTLKDDGQNGYELEITGGKIVNPQALKNVFSDNDDYKKIHTIKITDPIKITNSAEGLFASLSGLKQIDGLDKIDTFSVTNMQSMFNGCSALTSLDLSNFDTSKQVDMALMFKDCTALNTLKLGSKFIVGDRFIRLPGPTWYKVGNGTLTHPQDTQGRSGTSFNNFNGSTDADTYVRLNLDDEKHTSTRAGNITIQYFDKDGKKIKTETIFGLLGGAITPKPEITDANGIKYHLIKDDSRNSKDVVFTDKEQNDIKFYYDKVSTNSPNTGSNNSNILGGDVTVHYQDEEGHSLAPNEII
jgi:surface protein